MTVRVIVLSASLLIASTILAQEVSSAGTTAAMPTPFGIRMGTPKENLGEIKEVAPFKYTLKSVPRPHSDFESYIVQATPKAGVCWVKAIGKNVSTSEYGNELRTKFKELEEQITSVYGPSEHTDLLRSGALWDEPREWLMSVRQGERVFATFWGKDKGSRLPDGVTIFLGVSTTRSSGYPIVEYSFPNEAACEAEVKEGQKQAF